MSIIEDISALVEEIEIDSVPDEDPRAALSRLSQFAEQEIPSLLEHPHVFPKKVLWHLQAAMNHLKIAEKLTNGK